MGNEFDEAISLAPDAHRIGARTPLRTRKTLYGERTIVMRTSDSITFKKCRRSWSWSSHLMRNLGSKNLVSHLWFGSGIHYALEDFHGERKFEEAADAFAAYCIATSKQATRELPHNTRELYELGIQMMSYYQHKWLATRDPMETYVEDGVLQTEVEFLIPVPLDEYPQLKALAAMHGADSIAYGGTIDRVAVDKFGRLWVVEYKTAAQAEHYHYMTDPQVTRYVWAARHIYNRPIAGVAYVQFIKKEPNPPKVLGSGRISTAANQATSSILYREQMEAMYGSITAAPEENRNYLATLMSQEDEHRDRYIQRVLIERNEHATAAEAQAIVLELEDMLNPKLSLYPNPTRECSRMCSFLGPCVSFSDGGDWEHNLAVNFVERDKDPDKYWRRRLPNMEMMRMLRESGLRPDLEDVQLRIESLDPEERMRIERGEDPIEFTFD